MTPDPLREFVESIACLDEANQLRRRAATSLTVLIEQAQDALAHADALAASPAPVREWRGVGYEEGFEADGLTGVYATRYEAQHALDVIVEDEPPDPPFQRYGLQERSAPGPWVDVPAEGHDEQSDAEAFVPQGDANVAEGGEG